MLKSLLLKKTTRRRAFFFMMVDSVLLTASVSLAFFLRFDGNIPTHYLDKSVSYLAVFLAVKLTIFAYFRLYRMSWSYVGFYEFMAILKANLVSLFVLLGIIFLQWSDGLFRGFPRSIALIDFALSLVMIVLFRASKRMYRHSLTGRCHPGAKRTLIIGAGNAGEQIVRDMRRQPENPYNPVGFIDDDKTKRGIFIQGIEVLGDRQAIVDVVARHRIDLVLIAIPSAPSKEIRKILKLVRQSGVAEIKTIPGLNELVHGKLSLSDIKEIHIEDILGREQVGVDEETVRDFIRGRVVLITGAGGSIGSELLRQVMAFHPEKVVAVEIDETELYGVELEMGRRGLSEKFVPVLADVRDPHKMHTVFEENAPDLVFHAAAYKHVPMMEKFPEEAVKVNIFGTKILADAAARFGADTFVMVSTDKAVRPTNVMGATKRVAEKVVNAYGASGKTRFVSVRFGNVVGSRGSVIPVFEEQIRQGGPVTVTHAEMQRYFMSIPEACILILQAAAMGGGGEVFLLDMGDPIRIVDMAREMIRLNGLEPEFDIPIVYTGVRAGEKLYEELLTDTEGSTLTKHPKIFVATDVTNDNGHILEKVALFEDLIEQNKWAAIRNLLNDLVPSYQQSPGGLKSRAASGMRINSGETVARDWQRR